MDLQSLRDALNAKKTEKQGYLKTAADIKVIYDRMKEDKDAVIGYKKSVKSFIDEEYSTFKGDLFVNTYQAKGNELISAYETVITNIDTNLDRLNNAKCDYENKAYACDPIIGHLEGLINSIITSIQNQLN
ncbi:hypothetical protein SAMN04487830_12228 [Pseudobutyrivibrio sp. OR37]|uniref:hypothetical protein n=1 Tax=Pseudobutyrivibrio sp. OR37 TaxID=1798186 RepID=UPI0008F44356|nr:hypothetical protein [Pseudobutyrivibrio sp. OR37]SFI09811.1 hypothetical protein SAMN04487830_12228 [Pseudobutyrivibrio sp. OR37]